MKREQTVKTFTSILPLFVKLTRMPLGTSLILGSQYALNITTEANVNNVAGWLDFNNDGIFSTAELIGAGNSNSSGFTSLLVTIPTTAVLNTSLRLRVISSYNTISGACFIMNYSQCEDYSVNIVASSAKPVADFTYNSNPANAGSTTLFSDLSSNGPTSWNWIINGANITTSVLQNPTAIFPVVGAYSVTLIATNSYGSDTITKTVTVINNFNLCNPSTSQTLQALNGNLYDSGGPTGNYGNSENCNFLINPNCADSIIMNITDFNSESGYDFLRIYDGVDAFAPLIFSKSGPWPSLPPVIATSGSMYISWQSDGSYSYPGFQANWQTKQLSLAPPTANFNFTPAVPALLDTVFFTNLSSAAANSWQWDFGDGTSSTLQNPTHLYASAGTYAVTLIAQTCGASDTFSNTITTQGAPSINFSPTSFNLSVGCNDTVNLNLQISNTGAGTLNWQGVNNTAPNLNLLVWNVGADLSVNGEYQNTLAALNQYYTNYIFDSTSTTSSTVLQSKLSGKATLLVMENETNIYTGITNCAATIQSFVQNGGTVIFLGDQINAINSGIFSGFNFGGISNNLQISNTTFPITNTVPSIINYQNATIGYQFTNTNRFTLVHEIGNPSAEVVTYLPYGLGKAIYIGFDYYAYDSNSSRILANAVEWGLASSTSTSPNIYTTPSSGSTAPGGISNVTLQIMSNGLSGGFDTLFAYFNSNDPLHVKDSIPIYLTVSNLPCVSFGNLAPSGCSGNISFKDSTTNVPTSWLWDFGDGNTSTAQHPSHSYSLAGTYTVKLIATNSTGTDSISKVITITNVGGPIAANCVPPNGSIGSYGITNVNMASINNTSIGSINGYQDYTCPLGTVLHVGSQYALKITLESNVPNISSWIDFNNDGIFSSAESIGSSISNNLGIATYLFQIPSSAVLNTPIRMRVSSSYFIINGPCDNISYGQTEDYSVKIVPTVAKPVADFIYSPNSPNAGSNTLFTDLSTNGPTSWSWIFNGATISTSALQNPTAIFSTAGVFPITLIATNNFGSDTITKLITITNNFNLCSPISSQTTQSPSGNLYDSGGPTGDYTNYENCSLLISPNCADSIILNITSFSTESGYDYLKIYDGINASAPLLFNQSGFGPSSTQVKASSGNMFVVFTTDGSSTYPGFACNWQTVFLSTVAPTANFTYLPTTPALLDTVFFTNLSSTSAIAWNWNFGDGTTSTLQNPFHAYGNAGTYTITLIAQSCGASDTFVSTITTQGAPIINTAPLSFNLNLGCNDTANLNLQISNSGIGTLNWQTLNNSSNNNILVWTVGADMLPGGEYQNTISALNQNFTNYVMDSTSTNSSTVLQSKLNGKSLLLVVENELGTTSGIINCASTIQNFVQNGGSVIFLGDNTNPLNSGIFMGTPSGIVYGDIQIVNTSYPITNLIPSTINNQNATISYQFTNSNKIPIGHEVGNSTKDIITYLPYGSGKAIYLGFDYFAFNNNTSKILANSVEWALSSSNINSNNVFATPNAGSVNAAGSSNINLQITSNGLLGGLDTLYFHYSTNDPLHSQDSIPIYLNISMTPCVSFGSSLPLSCSGLIAFTDSTTNNPTNWLWKFGDGSTSTIQNPSHTYATPGTYTVTLIATNSTSSDSNSKVIIITSTTAPIAASCVPSQNTPSSLVGIYSVTLNTINNISGNATEGNMDFTCSASTNLIQGSTYTFSAITFYPETLCLWIDYNNNGIFDLSELLSTSFTNTNHQITFTVPNTSVINVPLRLRVASDYGTTPTACGPFAYSQSEDYSISIAPILPVLSTFTATPTVAWVNENIQFSNTTLGIPTSWQWQLLGSTSPAANFQNPLVSYPVAGTYSARLIATNGFYTDTTIKVNYITINPLPAFVGSYTNTICDGTFSMSATLPQPYTSMNWDFGDGSSLNNSSSSQVHKYNSSGTYTVVCTANSPYGTKVANMVINVIVFQATISHTGMQIPNNILNFNVNTTGTLSSYNWNFGDGSTSTLAAPSHTYTTAGTFYISCEIQGSTGCKMTLKDTIIMSPENIIHLANAFNINVSPNPFSNNILIEVLDLDFAENMTVKLRNNLGQVIYANSLNKVTLKNKSFEVNPKCAPGVYVLEILINDRRSTFKVIKKE